MAFGFDEFAYLKAMKKVPIISRKTVHDVMSFVSKFAHILSTGGYRNLRLSRILTENNALMNSLKKSEAQYRLLVENQTDLIVKTDINGKYLYASPSFCTLFGLEEKELLGNTFIPYIQKSDRPGVRKAMKALFQPPYTCVYELRSKTTQSWRWFRWSCKAILGEQNEILAVIGCGRDITDQKLLEKELHQARQTPNISNVPDIFEGERPAF